MIASQADSLDQIDASSLTQQPYNDATPTRRSNLQVSTPPANQFLVQLPVHSFNQTNNQSISQPNKQSFNQTNNHSSVHSFNQTNNHSPNHSISPSSPQMVINQPIETLPYHFAYLHSWPLISVTQGTNPLSGNQSINQPISSNSQTTKIPIPALDFDSERRTLHESLSKSHRNLRCFFTHATTDHLLRILVHGCSVIHYSGHGMIGALAFEDEDACMKPVSGAMLKNVLNTSSRVKLFVVSACYSESSADALIEAGVEHVIAVRADSQVHDAAAQTFMAQFYYALFIGRTIKESFETAKAAVLTSIKLSNNHSSTHPNELEHSKFLLLPTTTDHNVSIFNDVVEGPVVDLSTPPTPNNLRTLPQAYVGRNADQQEVIARLHKKKKRCVTLYGSFGVGKSTLAMSAASYMAHRNHYDGIFSVDLRLLITQPLATLATLCSNAMSDARLLDTIYNDNNRFITFLKNDRSTKKYLFIFDEGELGYAFTSQSQRSLPAFITQLINETSACVLVAALDPMGLQDAQESLIKVESLSPSDAMKLFFALKTREIAYPEFGYHGKDSQHAARVLMNHPALQRMAGVPRRILAAVQFLRDHTMESLVKQCDAICEQSAREEKERRAAYAIEPILHHDATAIALWKSMGGRFETSRSQLESALQRHLNQCCSPPNVLHRILSSTDLAVIAARIKMQPPQNPLTTISVIAFSTFWPWFSSIANVISNCCSIWNQWLPVSTPTPALHSFLTREQCVRMLRSMDPHTCPAPFLLRLSESHPQCLTIAWIDVRDREQYTLVQLIHKSDGIVFSIALDSGSTQSFHTIPNLLLSVNAFQTMYPGIPKQQVFTR